MAEPERFVEPDPELPLALLDQKEVSIAQFHLMLPYDQFKVIEPLY